MNGHRIDLSIIIVTHNAARVIAQCIASVQKECESLATEILVVDSGSQDDTVDTVRALFPNLPVQSGAGNIGFSAANNRVLGECSGRYVMLLNPDTVVHEGAVAAMIQELELHPECGAVGPRLLLPDGSVQQECARNLPTASNMIPWLLLLDKARWKFRFRGRRTVADPRPSILDGFNLLAWTRESSCAVECLSGACMLIRREVVDRVGPLDESAPMYLDDLDYCRRIHDAGWTLRFVAGARITHQWGHSSRQRRRDGDFYALVCHALWLYLRKHDGAASAMLFSVTALVGSVLRLAFVWPAATLLARSRFGEALQRQLDMSLGLARWAVRFPKCAPALGFVDQNAAERVERVASSASA